MLKVKKFAFYLAIASAVIVAFGAYKLTVFRVPADSMAPTIPARSLILVNRFAYGIGAGQTLPARGDLIMFKNPKRESVKFVKRVIGLPGDEVQLRQDVLIINGIPVPRELVGQFTYRERLPEGVEYEVLEIRKEASSGPFSVPANHLFVLGDNRDNSLDSRRTLSVGPVPAGNVLGEVVKVF